MIRFVAVLALDETQLSDRARDLLQAEAITPELRAEAVRRALVAGLRSAGAVTLSVVSVEDVTTAAVVL